MSAWTFSSPIGNLGIGRGVSATAPPAADGPAPTVSLAGAVIRVCSPSVALLALVPVFLLPAVGGPMDMLRALFAGAAVWLAIVLGRLATRPGDRDGTSDHAETVSLPVLAGLTVLLVLVLVPSLAIGPSLVLLTALVLGLEATRCLLPRKPLPVEIAMRAAIAALATDAGAIALGVERHALVPLLASLVAVVELLCWQRSSRRAARKPGTPDRLRRTLGGIELALLAGGCAALSSYVVLLTVEPTIQSMAGAVPMISVPMVLVLLLRRLQVAGLAGGGSAKTGAADWLADMPTVALLAGWAALLTAANEVVPQLPIG